MSSVLVTEKYAYINWSAEHNRWRILLDSGKQEVFAHSIRIEGKSETTTYNNDKGLLKMAIGAHYNYSRMEGATTLILHI
jgi:hypothetical protein